MTTITGLPPGKPPVVHTFPVGEVMENHSVSMEQPQDCVCVPYIVENTYGTMVYHRLTGLDKMVEDVNTGKE